MEKGNTHYGIRYTDYSIRVHGKLALWWFQIFKTLWFPWFIQKYLSVFWVNIDHTYLLLRLYEVYLLFVFLQMQMMLVHLLKPYTETTLLNVGLILGQRCRRWTNIKPALGQFFVFAGYASLCVSIELLYIQPLTKTFGYTIPVQLCWCPCWLSSLKTCSN